MDVAKSIFDPYVIAFLIILIIFIYLFTKYRGRRELVLFGSLWFFIMLLPQSNLIFPLILAEHFLYLPCIGIFLIIGNLLGNIRQNRRKFAFVILVSWILFYSSLAIIQNFNWTNTLTFFKWTLKFSPFSYNAHYCLGNYYADNDLFDSAINKYEKVIEIIDKDKDKIWLLPIMHHNIGTMLSRKGLLDEAEKEYKKAIELDPKLIDTYNNLGCLYVKRAEFAKAKEIFDDALKINAKSEKIYYNLGVIYAQENNFEKANALWKKALEINPNYDVAKAAIKSLMDEGQR
ncbi:MAG: tetratricopeptide repeat protein [Candidatus Omnitrophota bacterium]